MLCVQADYVINVFNIGGITSVGLYQVSLVPLRVLRVEQSARQCSFSNCSC